MIRRILLTGILIVFAAGAAVNAADSVADGAAGSQVREFFSALEAYRQGDYEAAVDGFSGLIRSGVANPKLYYNLGNAFLKQGDLGRAVLWYEKAARCMPHDPDLRFNLNHARSLTKDARDPGGVSLVRILFFWRYQISASAIVTAALICNLILWATAAAYRLTRRRFLQTTALVMTIPTLILALTAGYNYYAAARFKQAIVLPAQVAVRAGLEETSTGLFELHAGAKVDIIKRLAEHCQIRYSEDKLGWVPEDVLGLL